VPCVLRFGPYSIYVYREVGGQHYGRHCHVRWADGDVSVLLPEIVPMHGTRLPARVLQILRDHQDVLLAAWQALNE